MREEDDVLHSLPDGPRSSARILIVEDDRDTAESMARLLKIFGYEVDVAREGCEAIALATRQKPDFVLLDIGLPGMDGYQVARNLKQEVTCKETVIIAVTGYGQLEDRDRSREAGIEHHLVKPIDHGVLLALLVDAPVPSPGNGDGRPAQEESANTSGMTQRGRGHLASEPGRSDPPAPCVPPSLLSCGDWPGATAEDRLVPSRLTGEGWDR
jgi:CheY-like chemotaxis protein